VIPAPAENQTARIARLEGQVAALQAALERRSAEVRLLQRHLCPQDLVQWNRIQSGLPPLPPIAHEPLFWTETRDLTSADVPDTLELLWESLYPTVSPAACPPAEPAFRP
jgi:hypothetical protein